MSKTDTRNLKKRYLIWFYKVTKEALDKIERKFTQSQIDRCILKELKQRDKENRLAKYIAEFREYAANKEKDGISLKFEGKSLKPEYHFLVLKLEAIEKAIIKELGRPALAEVKNSYEKEMIKRILEERQEKR
jgi:hypothetical protein